MALLAFRRAKWRQSLTAAVLVAASALACAGNLDAADVTEQQVKAGFVYNFLRFIEWPDAAVAADQHLRLCLVGKGEIEREMEAVMKGKSANGHAIDVAYVKGLDEAQGCHVIFVDSSERRKVKAGLNPGMALLIGDFEGFAQQGGTINFLMQNNKIGFDINVASAQRAGLKVSSRLLAVAHSVIE
ncbi:MAG TPA: YfiR family protein [Terriglobales bacterium]|nr:YfiR family protein [Terriglobales bacterium]